MKSTRIHLSAILFFACTTLSAQMVEVYQWTDEDGVVHFSQFAPDEQAGNVETVSVDGGEGASHGLGISEEDDPEGYKAHREEMEALWAEREARREAARNRQAQAPRTEYIYVQQEYASPFIYPRYGYRPPNRPPDKPRPRPGVDPVDPGNAPPKTATWKRR